MGKCFVCGKHGLFLKVDDQRRCKECAEDAEKEEVAIFETYYANLLHYLRDLQILVEVGDDPIRALEYIPKFENKIEECETLRAEIHNPKHEERLMKKLINSITYQDDFSKRYGIGKLEELEISVIADSVTKKCSTEKIFLDL